MMKADGLVGLNINYSGTESTPTEKVWVRLKVRHYPSRDGLVSIGYGKGGGV